MKVILLFIIYVVSQNLLPVEVRCFTARPEPVMIVTGSLPFEVAGMIEGLKA